MKEQEEFSKLGKDAYIYNHLASKTEAEIRLIGLCRYNLVCTDPRWSNIENEPPGRDRISIQADNKKLL